MEFLSTAFRSPPADIGSRSPERPSPISDFTAKPSRFLMGAPTLGSRELTLRWSISYPAPPNLATPIGLGFCFRGIGPAPVEYPFERTFLEGLEVNPEIVIQYRETPSLEPEISYDQESNTIIIHLNSHLEGKAISTRLVSNSRQIEEALKTRIYDVCSGDEVIQEKLNLTEGHDRDRYFRECVIPRMVEMRREALKEFTGREVIVVSKKQPYMKFPGYGEMSLRILPDGSTFIVLPHIDPIKGGMKKVKYGILISPNCDEISLHMICTLRDGTVRKSEEGRLIFYPKRVEYLSLFRGSFDAALKITHHDNILSPTALISHPGKYPGSKRVNPKNLEMIIPKCDVDLFEFLGDWYYEKRGTRSKDESVTHIRSAFQYLKEISSAMLHLHQSGYLYCDLKPENVMLKKLPNGSITAKLIDFDFLVSDKIRVKRFTTSYYPVEALFNLTKSH